MRDVKLKLEIVQKIDDYRAQQRPIPSFGKAVEQLLEKALKSET